MRLILVLVTAILPVACQYDPYASEFTRTKPEADTLPGRYQTDEESRRLFKRVFNRDVSECHLEVKGDGSFELRNVSECWGAIYGSGTSQHASGSWTLEFDQDWWTLQLRLSSIDGRPTVFGLPAMLRREKPPYLIHFTAGDPDSGHGLAFERVR